MDHRNIPQHHRNTHPYHPIISQHPLNIPLHPLIILPSRHPITRLRHLNTHQHPLIIPRLHHQSITQHHRNTPLRLLIIHLHPPNTRPHHRSILQTHQIIAHHPPNTPLCHLIIHQHPPITRPHLLISIPQHLTYIRPGHLNLNVPLSGWNTHQNHLCFGVVSRLLLRPRQVF